MLQLYFVKHKLGIKLDIVKIKLKTTQKLNEILNFSLVYKRIPGLMLVFWVIFPYGWQDLYFLFWIFAY